MTDTLTKSELIEAAHAMSQEIAKELLTPISHWFSGERSPGLELVVTAYMTAILGCSVVLEQLFGEEEIQAFLEKARAEASAFDTFTRH